MIVNLLDNIVISFTHSWSAQLAAIAFLFLLITLVFSYQRLALSLRFAAVTIVHFLSFFAVLGLISDVKYQTETQQMGTLLTYGTSQSQVDAISLANDEKIYVLSSTPNWYQTLALVKFNKQIIVVEEPSEIFIYQPDLNQLKVYGDGLITQKWQSLVTPFQTKYADKKNIQGNISRLKIDFYPSKKRAGPIALSWPKQLIHGQPFYIEGKFQGELLNEERLYNIALFDVYDQMIDEVLVKDNDSFNLSSTMKGQGLFTYQLKVFDDNQVIIASEPVSFAVGSAPQMKIAIIQSSPSFETKHLKNWLAEQGEEVLMLTKISKDKYIQQKFNESNNSPFIDESNANTVNRAIELSWLKHYQLIYMDGRSLLSLTENEKSQLNQVVKQGVGLIVMADDALFSATNDMLKNSIFNNLIVDDIGNTGFTITLNDEPISTTIPRWRNSQNKHAISFKNARLPLMNSQVIIKGSEQQPLWLKYPYGFGSLSISLVDASYQWKLSGEQSHYSQYWQTIISQVSKPVTHSGWQLPKDDQITFLGQPYNACAQISEQDKGRLNLNHHLLKLLPSVITKSAYCGQYWANEAGWTSLSLFSEFERNDNNNSQKKRLIDEIPDNIHNVFIYTSENWLTWQQNLKYQASSAYQSNVSEYLFTSVYKPIDKVYFWWLLFISLSLLWLEQKRF